MRLLMISNQVSHEGYAGYRQAFEEMVCSKELESFTYVTPQITSRLRGHEASLTELFETGRRDCPDVVLVVTPNGNGHEPEWVERFLEACGRPLVICYEADPWDGRVKPVTGSMAAWLAVADTVFTVAREPHVSLFRKHGADDVRYIAQTYCQVAFEPDPPSAAPDEVALGYDAVLIGSRFAHWGRFSRLPGAVERARLVRRLQRSHSLRLAIYGSGWSGPGAKGPLPFEAQTSAMREGRITFNWEHFPRHESYSGDRLPIGMIAGRVHVTTATPGFDWPPGREYGLFLESTVSAAVARIEELAAAPVEDMLQLGAAARTWARGRLSHRESARFMIAAADPRLLPALPVEPWHHFASEWPDGGFSGAVALA